MSVSRVEIERVSPEVTKQTHPRIRFHMTPKDVKVRIASVYLVTVFYANSSNSGHISCLLVGVI